MPNLITEDLKILENKPTAFSADGLVEIQRKIDLIVRYCNETYYNQSFYGNAALNRKILLDRFVSQHLTSDVIHFLMSNPEYEKQKVTRKTNNPNNPNIEVTLKDVILHGFSDGLTAIKILPNNERDYDKDSNDEQKRAYDTNTVNILREIQKATGRDTPYSLSASLVPHQHQLLWITNIIDSFKTGHASDQLLFVPGYSAEEIREQVNTGFKSLCEILGVKPNEIEFESFCEKFLTCDQVFLNGDVSHLFYDRLHLTAALESDQEICFANGVKCNYRKIFETLVRKIENEPEKYSVAAEQISMRLELIKNNFQENFSNAIKLHHVKQNPDLSPGREKSFDKKGKYLLVQGPLPKSVFTIQLEKIASRLLASETPEIKMVGEDIFLLFNNGNEIYNLSDIIANANFEHIYLQEDSHRQYSEFMKTMKDCDIKSGDDFTRRIHGSPHKAVYEKLSLAEAQAINYYTYTNAGTTALGGYRLINNLLRNLPSQNIEDIKMGIIHAVMLGSALGKLGTLSHPISDVTLAERYFNDYGQDLKSHALYRGVASLTGFVSTTSDTSKTKPAKEKFILADRMKSKMNFVGLKGFPIQPLSTHGENEEEILMPPTQIQVSHYKPLGPDSAYEEITVSAVSDLASYRARSLKTNADLNYHPIAPLFKEIDSTDMVFKNKVIALIHIYHTLNAQNKLTPENQNLFSSIMVEIEKYKAGQTTPNNLSENLIKYLKPILNVNALEIALRCYLKSAGTLQLMEKAVFDELSRLGLISQEHLLLGLSGDNKPDQNAIHALLDKALEDKRWDIVLLMCNLTEENKPSRDHVIKALDIAVTHKKWDVVTRLCAMPDDENKPDQVSVVRAFKAACLSKTWDAAICLCNLKGNNKPNQIEVTQALNDCFASGRYPYFTAISLFCDLKGDNKPAKDAVANVLLRVTYFESANDLVKLVCYLPGDNKPDSATVSKALKTAVEVKNYGAMIIMCGLQDNKPDRAGVAEAWKKAAEIYYHLGPDWDALIILSGLKGDNKLVQSEVSKVVKIAAERKKWDVVARLCGLTKNKDNRPDQATVSEIILLAAQAGKFDLVLQLCELKPNQEAASIILEGTGRSGLWDIVTRLCSLTGDSDRPNEEAVSETLKSAARAKKWDVVELLCGLKPSQEAVLEVLAIVRAGEAWPDKERVIKTLERVIEEINSTHQILPAVSDAEIVSRILCQIKNPDNWLKKLPGTVTIEDIAYCANQPDARRGVLFVAASGASVRQALSELGMQNVAPGQITEESVKFAIGTVIAAEKNLVLGSNK